MNKQYHSGDLAREIGPEIRGREFCRAALTDRRLTSELRQGATFGGSRNLLFMDGAEHLAVRRILAKYLDSAKLIEVKAALKRSGDAAIARLTDAARPDLLNELAEPLTAAGIISAMSVSSEMGPKLIEHARAMVGVLEPQTNGSDRHQAVNAAMRAALLFEKAAREGKATGLHAFLEEAAGNGIIGEKLARTTPVIFLHGGYENPLNLLSATLAWAVEDQRRFREWASRDRRRILDEVMRSYSPVRRLCRRSLEPLSFPNVEISSEQLVWIDLESAATARDHLGFGSGSHACPGVALARLECDVLIDCLLDLPDHFLDHADVLWNETQMVRGAARIRVDGGA